MAQKTYQETINKNLERVDKLVEDSVTLAAEGYPLFSWLEISPIDSCNRKCVFCPRSDAEVAPNQNMIMPKMLYEKLAQELKEISYSGTVMLAGYGEPLLSSQIISMTEAFSRVCNTEITTNGDPLTPKVISRLMEAGASKLILSLYDGPQQVEKFSAMFAEAGAPSSFYVFRDRWYTAEENYGVKLTNRSGTVTIGNQRPVDKTQKCYYPHYSMMIDWNGNVYLCPQDWNRKMIAGNLLYSTLVEVWTSTTLRKYRKSLARGQRDLSPCSKCNADGTLHGLQHVNAWNKYFGGATGKNEGQHE